HQQHGDVERFDCFRGSAVQYARSSGSERTGIQLHAARRDVFLSPGCWIGVDAQYRATDLESAERKWRNDGSDVPHGQRNRVDGFNVELPELLSAITRQ